MDNSLKDKVLESVDIVDVVGERVTLTRKGKDFTGLCPFHPDHKPSLAVSPSKRIFKCWSCGAGGDVIRFVELYERVDFRAALASLAKRAGIELRSSPVDRRAAEMREQIMGAIAWARQHFQRNLLSTPTGQQAVDYALGRGLTRETIERHGLGLAPDSWNDLLTVARRAGLRDDVLRSAGLVTNNERGDTYDRFRRRLIFPITDAQGRPIAFGGRTLGDDPAKYLNSPETVLFSKSRVLYAFDLARRAIEEQNAVIVVEGYLDAVLLHQYGFTHAVATLGTALTDAHAKLLTPRAARIYLCFDGDQAGIKAADRAVEVALRTQAEVRVVLLDGGQDPADCVVAGGTPAFQASLNKALDALEFKWRQTLRSFGQGGQTARRAAVEAYLRFVAGATSAGGVDPLQQNLLVGRLSDLLGVPSDSVFELLAAAKRALPRQTGHETAEFGGVSTYQSTTAALPAGLTTAMETVLGLLLSGADCWSLVDDCIARTAEYSQTWKRLYDVLLEAHADMGEYSLGEIVARCEDGALLELADRARARIGAVTSPVAEFVAARDRLASELSVLRAQGLHEHVRTSGGEDEEAFRSLRENATAQDWLIPPESRWNQAPASA